MNTVAFDSNILSYFIKAIDLVDTDSEVQGTHSDLLKTKIALVRACFYSDRLDEQFLIVPTAEYECQSEDMCKENREKHWVFARTIMHTIEKIPLRKCQEVKEKVRYYLEYHNKEKDCRILAEAEVLNCNIVLTYDKGFYNNLKPHASIAIKKPIEYWESLGVPKGSPFKRLGCSHPFSQETWWKW